MTTDGVECELVSTASIVSQQHCTMTVGRQLRIYQSGRCDQYPFTYQLLFGAGESASGKQLRMCYCMCTEL